MSPSFKEIFTQQGQEVLNKNKYEQQLTYSVAPLITGLMVLAGALYFLSPIASIVCLVLALIALWGRWVLDKQLRGDLLDMERARQLYQQDNNPEYMEFVRLRSAQILEDNKVLSPFGRSKVIEAKDWATTQAQ